MADLNARIKPKKSSTSGEAPLAADLEVAELAINTADGTLFTKHTDNTVVTISGGGTSLPTAQDGEALIYEDGQWVAGPVIGGVNYTRPNGDQYFNQTEFLINPEGADGSTTFTDLSDNAATISVTGNPAISTTQSKFGSSSIYFNGDKDDYLSIPNASWMSFGSNDFTIEAWVYINGNSNYNQIQHGSDDKRSTFLTTLSSTSGDANNSWDFRFDGNTTTTGTGLRFFYRQSNLVPINVAGTVTIAQQTWHHVAAVRSGNTISLYLNGTSIATQDITGVSITSTRSMVIGTERYGNQPTTTFDGYIDGLRIASGIARYTSSFTPPTAAFPEYSTDPVTIPYSIDKLDDVDTSTVAPTDGQVLLWDNTASKWEPGDSGTVLPTAQDGEALIWENGQWVAGPVIGGVDYTLPTGGTQDYSTYTPPSGFSIWTDEFLLSSGLGTLSNNDLISTQTGTGELNSYSATTKSTGKWYWEIEATTLFSGDGIFGIVQNPTGGSFPGGGNSGGIGIKENGTWWTSSAPSGTSVTNVSSTVDGDIMMFALDADASKLWFGRNGTWDNSGDPAAGTGDIARGWSNTLVWYFAVRGYWTGTTYEKKTYVGDAQLNVNIPYSIDKLDDVDTSTVAPTDGQVLAWDNAAGKWEPETVYTLPSGTSDGDVPIWDNGQWVTGPSVNTLRQNYTPPSGFEVWNDTFLLRDPSLATLSSDGFTATYGSGVTQAYSTTTKSTGKWYWEIKLNGSTDGSQTIGIGTSTNNWVGSSESGGIGVFVSSGSIANNSGGTAVSSISSIAADDVMMFALDADAKKLWIGKNGTWENSGDPVAGTGEVASAWPDGKDWMFIGRLHSAGQGYTIETSGSIGTGIEVPSTIDDLDDVDTSTVAPTDGQALTWDNTAQKWEPETIVPDGTTDSQVLIWEQGQWAVGSAASTLQSDYTAPSGFAYWSDTFLLRDPANATLSNNDLTATYGSAVTQAYSTTTRSTGKWYWEIQIDGGTDGNSYIGIGISTNNWVGSSESGGIGVNGSGGIANNSGGSGISSVSSHVAGDVRMFALDADAKKLWIGKNGTWDNSGDPAAGTGEVASGWPDGNDWMFICRLHTSGFGNTIKVTGSLGAGIVVPDSIDDLSDVDTSTVAPTDGQALLWDNTAQKWEPGTVSGGGGTTLPSGSSDGEALIWENGAWAVGPVIGGVDYTGSGGDSNFSSVELLALFNGTDGSQAFTDSSPVGHTLTPTGSSSTVKISTTQSKFGGASGFFDFGYISLSSSIEFQSDPFTVEAWIYPTVATLGSVFSNRDSGGMELVHLSDGSIRFLYGNGIGFIDTATTVPLNSWSHIAVTRDSNDLFTIWIDGVDSGNNTFASANLGTGRANPTIARRADSASQHYRGYIDDLRVTNGVCRYTADFTPPTAELPSSAPLQTTIPYSIDKLEDVDTSTVAPTDGQALLWDNTAQKWEPGDSGTALPAAQDGETLIWENGQWVAGPVIGGVDYTLPTGTTYTVPTGFTFWDDTLTIEPAAQASTVTLTNGDRTAEQTGGVSIERNAVSISTKSTGKWYWEVLIDVQNTDSLVGITPNPANGFPGSGSTGGIGFYRTGQVYNDSGATASNNSAFVTGDTLMLALDADAKKLWFGKNGTWDNSGDPAAGTGALATNWTGTPDWYFACRFKGLGGEKYTLVYGTSTVIPAADSIRSLLGIGEYADDAAAGSGGVASGAMYYNTTSSDYRLKS